MTVRPAHPRSPAPAGAAPAARRPGPRLWRLRWVVGALAVVELVAGVGVAAFATRSTPVGVDDAVARFRAQQATGPGDPVDPGADATATTPSPVLPAPDPALHGTAPPTPPAPAAPTTPAAAPSQARAPAGAHPSPAAGPAEGVYVYATTGSEELDVGGARHQYPAETTITVTRTGCGVRYRWQPLEERWDERDTCPSPAGERLVAFRSHHEFFGRSDERAFTCEPGSLARPAEPRPGTTWTNRCRAGTTVATTTGRILGIERLDVGGTAVEAVHFVLESRIDGDGTGTARYEVWALWDTGLVARQIAAVESTQQGPVGAVRYRERYDLRLRSLKPRR